MPLSRVVFTTLAAVLASALSAGAALAQNSMLRLQTTLGLIDIQLYDMAAPITVANFLGYVNRGAYTNSMFHRSARGFVVQGGGYTYTAGNGAPVKVPAASAIVNEFSTTRSNLRGTVAMAKLGGNPNSATSEWFVNLANNSANLDNQNGGFTVFGRVTESGMAVFDAIAALRVVSASASFGSAFATMPIVGIPRVSYLPEDTVRVSSASVLPASTSSSASDRLFNYLEARYPQFISPAGAASDNGLGYYFRYYAATNSYVGTKDGAVYYLVPAISNDITLLGSLAEWLAMAAAQGY